MSDNVVKPSTVAYKAAEIMAERGFCQGRMQDGEGRVCFFGALNRAWPAFVAFDMALSGSDIEAFMTVSVVLIRDRTGRLDLSPAMYNDLPSTTGEDVILLLKETASVLEGQGL